MKYIKRNLSSSEKIVKKIELSKLGLIVPYIWVAWSILTMLSYISIGSMDGVIMGLSTGLVMAIYPTYKFIRFYSIEQAITNKRVIRKIGIISRDIDEIRLAKVETVEFNQTILGRIFNYGNVSVTGTGNSYVVFRFVSNPRVLKNYIDNLLDE